jgi:hypothetical protein
VANLKFDKEITALLVIDPYNDFISEGGKRSLGNPFTGERRSGSRPRLR